MRMIDGEQYKKRNARGKGCGKDAPWKSPKADFSTSLGNPAKNAGFPLFTQPRLLLILFPWWTHWFRPKLAELAPFITGPNNAISAKRKLNRQARLFLTLNAEFQQLFWRFSSKLYLCLFRPLALVIDP